MARVKNHVEHAAALHAVGGSVGTFRINIALVVTVIAGIGVNKATDGAMFLRDLGLDAAPTAAVTCYDDFASDVDTLFPENVVVRWDAVIDVHKRSADIAVAGIGVEARDHVGVGGVFVRVDGWLFQPG